ncbi:hypothetical protein JAAARDRAFT_74548 [Jaapia argillacea MUCL 33604]|uniref:DUF6534 domain-containing protein n=1 Tax=Jaapia argillacea MUCL 33604 TaxID=933084 RepID=A0A067P465_9AGAM|nr:hypothetical protein JAAARDRAFT_74548 [Jaapia argillacea MUCL 33604]
MPSISVMRAHPVAYLAPTLTSMVVQAFQTGLFFDLSIKFWSRAHREHKLIRTVVGFVSVVLTYQMIATFTSLWRLDVVHFGDWKEQFVLTGPDRMESAVMAALASPIQAFLIRRCWMLTNKNSLILVLLSSLLLSTIALSVYLCFAMFSLSLSHPQSSALPVNGPYIWNLILTAVLDFTLTSILSIFLWRSRSDVYTRRVRRTIRRVILISWEAAALPAVCALLAAILRILMGHSNYWSLFFRAIIGKFYAISLLTTLNSRSDFRRVEHVQGPSTPYQVATLPRTSIAEEGFANSTSSPAQDSSGGESSLQKTVAPDSDIV